MKRPYSSASQEIGLKLIRQRLVLKYSSYPAHICKYIVESEIIKALLSHGILPKIQVFIISCTYLQIHCRIRNNQSTIVPWHFT